MDWWLYQFLFVDQKTQELSSSKLWFHIGIVTALFTVWYSVIHNQSVPDGVFELVTLVVLNRFGRKIAEHHYGK